MGTRLYPNTDNDRIIEFLAGVPATTHTKLNEINELCPQSFREAQEEWTEEDYWAWFELLQEDPNVAKLNTFKNFGWGKFDYDLLPDDNNDTVGHTEDPKLAVALVHSATNGFNFNRGTDIDRLIAEIGVCWF